MVGQSGWVFLFPCTPAHTLRNDRAHSSYHRCLILSQKDIKAIFRGPAYGAPATRLGSRETCSTPGPLGDLGSPSWAEESLSEDHKCGCCSGQRPPSKEYTQTQKGTGGTRQDSEVPITPASSWGPYPLPVPPLGVCLSLSLQKEADGTQSPLLGQGLPLRSCSH